MGPSLWVLGAGIQPTSVTAKRRKANPKRGWALPQGIAEGKENFLRSQRTIGWKRVEWGHAGFCSVSDFPGGRFPPFLEFFLSFSGLFFHFSTSSAPEMEEDRQIQIKFLIEFQSKLYFHGEKSRQTQTCFITSHLPFPNMASTKNSVWWAVEGFLQVTEEKATFIIVRNGEM